MKKLLLSNLSLLKRGFFLAVLLIAGLEGAKADVITAIYESSAGAKDQPYVATAAVTSLTANNLVSAATATCTTSATDWGNWGTTPISTVNCARIRPSGGSSGVMTMTFTARKDITINKITVGNAINHTKVTGSLSYKINSGSEVGFGTFPTTTNALVNSESNDNLNLELAKDDVLYVMVSFTNGDSSNRYWYLRSVALDITNRGLEDPTITIDALDYEKLVGDQWNLNASTNSGATLTYESDNETVATVDASGNIEAKAIGQATITVTSPAIGSYDKAVKEVSVMVTPGSIEYSFSAGFDGELKSANDPNGYITYTETGTANYNAKYSGRWKGTTYENGLKIQSTSTVSVNMVKAGTIQIVQSMESNNGVLVKVDNKVPDVGTYYVDTNNGVRVYTLHLDEGTHDITRSSEWGLIFIGVKWDDTNVTLGAGGYATYCSDVPFTVTGAKAYKGAVSGNYVTLTAVNESDEVIPANAGVILYVEDGESQSVTITPTATAATADMAGNALQGTTSRIETPANCMALNAAEGEFQSYTGAYFPANKAYLVNGGSAKTMRVVFGNTTAIKTVNAEATTNKAVKRIMNGQLVIEKAGKMYNAAGAEMK